MNTTHTVEIIRWKREACTINVEAVDTKDAHEQALCLYFGGVLEKDFDTEDENFNPDKDERIKIYSNEGLVMDEAI
ncbi:TPA: hypothetical protein ACQVKY_005203 [Serratia marcescens]|uniref:Uncharacterized protein n=1 Tax=Serratia nevei TaxID=2703794 RepID=A0ABT7G5I4_9GAMM|nr:hypothetical protein [Serratia nevei]HAU4290839.1 hypothetical protein [Serratia marcescens]MDK5169009.1 hypothetical protein [Serratia nevei]MDK5298503.1 hypothetical protein [Serratia nevei]MEC5887245.1 hypothetical protein [Serratia nevei]HAU4297507.1 hypothetical protein [Serratia marcescens]